MIFPKVSGAKRLVKNAKSRSLTSLRPIQDAKNPINGFF